MYIQYLIQKQASVNKYYYCSLSTHINTECYGVIAADCFLDYFFSQRRSSVVYVSYFIGTAWINEIIKKILTFDKPEVEKLIDTFPPFFRLLEMGPRKYSLGVNLLTKSKFNNGYGHLICGMFSAKLFCIYLKVITIIPLVFNVNVT